MLADHRRGVIQDHARPIEIQCGTQNVAARRPRHKPPDSYSGSAPRFPVTARHRYAREAMPELVGVTANSRTERLPLPREQRNRKSRAELW
jgi:hypothetical protein